MVYRHIRFFECLPTLWRQRSKAVVTLVALAVSIGLPQTAWSVVINTSTGTGNTSAPADNPGWANVGALGIGTGVYLGNDWVLTTKQVGGGSIVLNGGTYAMLAGSGTQLTNGGSPGKTALTDLYLFRLATTPIGLGSVAIASSSGTGAAVTMIGAGLDRGAFTQWNVDMNTGANPWTWTEVSSGGNFAGYQTLSTREMRWGTNTVGSVGEWLASTYGDTNVVSTTFSYLGSDSTEAQAAYGDFGGGVFQKNGSTWELTGLMIGVAGFSGQPDPEENAVFGDTTFAADLSFYRPQIMAIVPEPHSVVLAASGLGGMVLWRLLHRRASMRATTTPREAASTRIKRPARTTRRGLLGRMDHARKDA